MPTERAVRRHWAERLWIAKGFDSIAEFLEPGVCFACGMDGKERAHIKARSVGGSDDVENIHILCCQCHKDSEYLEGPRYMAWLMERSAVDSMIGQAMRCGLNPAVYTSMTRNACDPRTET